MFKKIKKKIVHDDDDESIKSENNENDNDSNFLFNSRKVAH